MTFTPVPSEEVADLLANAKTEDIVVNGDELTTVTRTTKVVRTFAGINAAYDSAEAARNVEFQQFLAASGLEYPPLVYVDGVPLQVDRSTQTIERAGNIYSVKVPNTFPFVLTGTFATDAPNLVLRNDQTLRDDLADDGGAELIGYRSPLASAISRTVAGVLDEIVTVGSCGAIGDGVLHPLSEQFSTLMAAQMMYPFATSLDQSIDWAAFVAAGMSGATVKVTKPSVEYVLNDTVTRDNGTYLGDGYQSRVVFQDMAGKDGFVFSPTIKQTTSGCIDMAIFAKGSDGGKAISTPFQSIQYTQLRSSFVNEGLLIAGYTFPPPGTNNAFETIETWSCCIEQGDAWNVSMNEVDGYGSYRSDTDPSNQVQSCFIRLNAQSAMLTSHISHITCSNLYRGIEIGNRCFFQISFFDIAHVYDGIYQTALPADSFGESKIAHGNINAQHKCVYFNGVGTREISGVVSRRHRYGWKGATYDWHGVHLVDCNYVWVTNNQVQPDASMGAFSGNAYGLRMESCGGVDVEGFTAGLNLAFGIAADNTTMLQCSKTSSFQAGASETLFRLTNNTRESSLGEYKLVSSFAGTVYSDDGTIGGTVQFFGRDVRPVGNAPTYYLRRPNSGVDEKIWKLTSGATTLAIQATNDVDSSNVNALIFTRSGTTVTSADIRGNEVITAITRPRVNNTSTSGTVTFQWSDVLSVKGTFSGPLKPGQYTLATLPSAAAFSAYEIDVTDATGGSKRCRSNGSVWQILNTTTTVS